jgi:hypothetical protein
VYLETVTSMDDLIPLPLWRVGYVNKIVIVLSLTLTKAVLAVKQETHFLKRLNIRLTSAMFGLGFA